MTWTSHGPVQINVARDLHIHGGSAIDDLPCDVALPRASSGSSGWWTAAKVFAVVVAIIFGVPILACGAALAGVLFAAVCLLLATGDIGIWALCRFFEAGLWAERMAGGGRWRLIYVPSFMRSREFDCSGYTLEDDCDDTNGYTQAPAPVLTRGAQRALPARVRSAPRAQREA